MYQYAAVQSWSMSLMQVSPEGRETKHQWEKAGICSHTLYMTTTIYVTMVITNATRTGIPHGSASYTSGQLTANQLYYVRRSEALIVSPFMGVPKQQT